MLFAGQLMSCEKHLQAAKAEGFKHLLLFFYQSSPGNVSPSAESSTANQFGGSTSSWKGTAAFTRDPLQRLMA